MPGGAGFRPSTVVWYSLVWKSSSNPISYCEFRSRNDEQNVQMMGCLEQLPQIVWGTPASHLLADGCHGVGWWVDVSRLVPKMAGIERAPPACLWIVISYRYDIKFHPFHPLHPHFIHFYIHFISEKSMPKNIKPKHTPKRDVVGVMCDPFKVIFAFFRAIRCGGISYASTFFSSKLSRASSSPHILKRGLHFQKW